MTGEQLWAIHIKVCTAHGLKEDHTFDVLSDKDRAILDAMADLATKQIEADIERQLIEYMNTRRANALKEPAL